MTRWDMINRRGLLAGAAATALIAREAAASVRPPSLALPSDIPPPLEGEWRPFPVADPSLRSLDDGWLFHLGDIAPPPVIGHEESYQNAKAGVAQGAAAVSYDDSDWRTLDLPHDWAIEAPVDPAANVAQGYRRRGIGWYRRPLELDPAWRGRYLELQFGGIATRATVWFNGIEVAHSFSGYAAINIDITPYARFGEELNTIAIRVDADAMEGWWYEGAGIYRHAWLAVREAVSIVTDGIHANPVLSDAGGWSVPVTVDLANIGNAPAPVTVEAKLFDPDDRLLVSGTAEATATPLQPATAGLTLAVTDPHLWSPDLPTLYRLVTRLLRDGRVVDARETRVGFRFFHFDAEKGFFLNGRATKIKGVCIHQDHAGVGVAVPDALIDWRVRRLKALGCNALRSSHHAPTPELLDACDRHGLLVMDENRNFNPSHDYLEQLEWLVRRDRSRPSVFMWSVFNEEPMQGTEQGYEMVRRMAAAVKRLDTTRPVTAAMNDGMFSPVNVSQAVDVVGFNYQTQRYDRFHALHPDKPLTSSEDTSAFSTRGAWATNRAHNVFGSYDKDAADWGATHRDGWRAIATRPFIAGGFVWTGFDYHGEPTPMEWPSTSSFFGIMDICGFPKMAYHLHRAQWIDDAPLLELAPHWTWPGREGQTITMLALTNVERVTLRLNGRDLGSRAVDRLTMPEWQVPYAPGRLEAIGYRGGHEVIRTALETTGKGVALRLTPDRRVMMGDGKDAQPITVDMVDAAGRHVPIADNRVGFTIEGGTIIGLGNGDPNDHDPERGDSRKLFAGLAQLIVRADEGRGPLRVTASAPGLRPAAIRIDRIGVAPRPAIARTRPVALLSDWRRTAFSASRPDPNQIFASNDMNSLDHGRPGRLEGPAADAPWSMYRTVFTPRRRVGIEGGVVAFAQVVGRAEVWMDGKLLARKDSPEPAALIAPFGPGSGPRTLSLIVKAEAGAPSGMGRTVCVREREESGPAATAPAAKAGSA
jgi:beta-galactosidase